MVVKITFRHQKAKCVNTSLKVFYLFNFWSCFVFSFTFGPQFMPKVSKEQIFYFVVFYGQKTNMADMVKLGYGCIARK